MPKATVRQNAQALPAEPRFKVAHLFQDETLRAVVGAIEQLTPETPVLPASPFGPPAADFILRPVDRMMAEIRYRKANGMMTRADRRNYRSLEALRANLVFVLNMELGR